MESHLVNEMFNKTTAFARMWEMELRSDSVARFPIMRMEKPTEGEKYAEEIQILQQEFSSRFQDICKYEVIRR
jgi:hypothetical protein